MHTLVILGRQPAIGRAELESLYDSDHIRPVGPGAVMVDGEIDFGRLGSCVKAATYLDTVNSTDLPKIFDYCRQRLPDLVSDIPDGKIKLGTSLYGLDMPLKRLNASTLSLKSVLRNLGRSVRVVPNTELALTSAQTYHNQLVSAVGLELVIIRDGNQTVIGRVSRVQNINEYAERDRDRPRRDTRVGMLPPKLAQTIINLASGGAPSDQRVLLDPFCGTGVVLQEAALMGYRVYGSDIEERMVTYSRDNLSWLIKRGTPPFTPTLEIADATDHTWRQPIDIVACEGYLGMPFANEPPEAALRDTIMTCNLITKKFLRNLHPQLAESHRLCIAVPAWFVRSRVHHLPCLDDLTALGYVRVSFTHASSSELIYHRSDQIVGRELLVLQRIA